MISVIIPTHDRYKDIVKTLQIMKENDVFKNLESRVFIVFDGNTVSTEQENIIRKYNPCTHEPVILHNAVHVGQNVARNTAIETCKRDNPEYILSLDDDAHLDSNEGLIEVIGLFDKYRNAGSISLYLIKSADALPQSFNEYTRTNELFPVLFPTIGATILRADVVFKYNKFFYPDEIFYGSDEWVAAFRIRQAGYQIYATTKCKCIHRLVASGRSNDIRFRLQYGHAFIWTLSMPFRVAFLFIMCRAVKIFFGGFKNKEYRYVFQKMRGLIAGSIKGKQFKYKNDKEYCISRSEWMGIRGLMQEALLYKKNRLYHFMANFI